VERLGLQTWSKLQQGMPTSRDTAAQRQVAEIARRLLVAAGESPSSWEVRVFAQPDVNAFVLPGRKIGVFEGMLRVARSEGELAAVIGHEIGHLQAEHSRERVSAETLRHWGLQLISFLLQISEVEFAREIAALLGVVSSLALCVRMAERRSWKQIGLVSSRWLKLVTIHARPPRCGSAWSSREEEGRQSSPPIQRRRTASAPSRR
jgi:predicted Zn-dependent protease